jgi:hypothetical protein
MKLRIGKSCIFFYKHIDFIVKRVRDGFRDRDRDRFRDKDKDKDRDEDRDNDRDILRRNVRLTEHCVLQSIKKGVVVR